MTGIQIVKEAATTPMTTSALGHGELNPEQASAFLDMTKDKTALTPLVRFEKKKPRKGEIAKMGIRSRIMMPKYEGVAEEKTEVPEFAFVPYDCTQARVDIDVTEETFRYNIEGERFEDHVLDMLVDQVARDREDLCLNGDEKIATSATDATFLGMNDGWIKQMLNGGNVVDGSKTTDFDLSVFYKVNRAMPSKYKTDRLRWIMSPNTQSLWEETILQAAVTKGGHITDKRVESPCGYPIIACPAVADGVIALTDPQNLVIVNTYDIRIRKAVEGKSAIRHDMRFYSVFIDFDPIIQELEATAILSGFAPAGLASTPAASGGGKEPGGTGDGTGDGTGEQAGQGG